MFKFLWFFRKSSDEQFNDNDYDFFEVDAPPVSVQEMTARQKPVRIDNAFGAQLEHPKTPPVDTADKTRITDIEDKLREMVKDLAPRSREDQTVPDSQEDESRFDVTSKKLIGQGGENFVYEIPEDPSKVGRVEIEPLVKLIDEAAESEEQTITNENAAQQRPTLQERLAAENATYNELCTYFGNENVPQTTRSVRQVPISRELLETAYRVRRRGRDMPDVTLATNEMWTIVAIQEEVPQIADDTCLDVEGGVAERRDPADMNTETYKQAYEAATKALVCNPENASFDPNNPVDREQFLVIHPDLRAIVEEADTNTQLKASLKDFVEKAMRYSKETGKSLDLNGAKNILFFENTENSWSYKLVDALSPHAEEALVRMHGLMEKVIAGEPLISDAVTDEKLSLTFAINYIRTVNGLARIVGIEDHIAMLPQGQTITPSKFWEVLYDGGPPESSSQEQETLAA